MWRGRCRGLMLLFGALCLLAISAHAATFGCEMRTSCLSNQTILLTLNSSEAGAAPNNSHAYLSNFSSAATYALCCWTDAFRILNNSCAGNGARILGLQYTNNSHVQAGNMTGYVYSACYNVTAGSVNCEYPDTVCSAGYSSVASIASSESGDYNLTNAHIGDANDYKRKVCCKIGGQTAPSLAGVNLTPINTSKRFDLICSNDGTSDADGDAVTLHYNWYRNGTSITVLNLPMDYGDAVGITYDISGYRNNGTVSGATFLPTGGRVGGAFSLDGVNDYISSGNATNLNVGNGSFSVAFWVKLGSSAQSAKDVVSKYDDAAAKGFYIRVLGDDTLDITLSNGTSSANIGTLSAFSTGAYDHVVFTRNSSGVTVYFDGLRDLSTSSGGTLNIDTAAPLILGSNATANGVFFKGSLDEVMLFNRSLTPNEVLTLYNTNNAYLNRSELTKGEYWNCSAIPIDSTGLNGSIKRSNQSFVNVSVPTTVTLLYPLNNNQSVFERRVLFNWTATDEPDGDTVNYTLTANVTGGTCSNQIALSNIQVTNYTSSAELCTDQLYNWTVRACDSDGCSAYATQFNFTILSVLSITVVNNNTNFGTLTLGQNITTEDSGVLPFLLRNDGNIYVNITFLGNNSPFSTASLGSNNFTFKAADNETGSINASGSQITYTPVLSTFANAIKQLNYSDASDLAAIHINLSVPLQEPPGTHEANVTFHGKAG